MLKILSIIILNFTALATISINMNVEVKGKKVSKTISTEYGKEESIQIPNSKKRIILTTSNDIPENIPFEYIDKSVFLKLKVFEGDKLISSPEIVSLFGKDTFFSMQENPGEKPTISLKLNALKK